MIKFLWKGSKLFFFLTILTIILSVCILTYAPLVVGDITNELIYGQDLDIVKTVLPILFIIIASVGGNLFSYLAYTHFSRLVLKNIEVAVAKKLVQRIRSLADVTNVYNQEISLVVNAYLMKFVQLGETAVSFTVALVLCLTISWQIILWVIGFTLLSFLISQLFAKRLAALNQAFQDSLVERNKAVAGIFTAIRTVNIYLAKGLALVKLNRAFENKRLASSKQVRFSGYVENVNRFVGYLSQAQPISQTQPVS